MTRRQQALLVTIVGAVAAFLLAPQSPLGRALWPAPVTLDPGPTPIQMGLFMLLGAITALAFGAGLAFLVHGARPVRELVGPDRPVLARAVHLSAFWVLWNWWVHDSLHMVVGLDAGGLLAIEYAFHVTLMLAGAILAYGLVVVSGRRTGQRRATASAAGT